MPRLTYREIADSVDAAMVFSTPAERDSAISAVAYHMEFGVPLIERRAVPRSVSHEIAGCTHDLLAFGT